MYEYLLFDLDGTLTDPGLGITEAVRYALGKFGISVSDRKALYPFIGPPLWESFERFYHFSPTESEQAVNYYREYYKKQGLFENEVYEGIPALLQQLKDGGKSLLVATSKPEVFAVQILGHFGLASYFALIAGATMDSSRSKKADVIAYALARAGITDPARAVMIGDREQDIQGAQANGLASIGVLYGYGSAVELTGAGASHLARTPRDILNLV